MTAHKRVLLLGPTGVNKEIAVDRLRKYVREKFNHDIRYVDFEREFLKPELVANGIRNWFTFLAQDSNRQAMIWKSAWAKYPKPSKGEIVVMGMHASYVSAIVGLRCPIDLPLICEEFGPTLVVSLIDDVQNMWARTERRADGKDARGRPSFEQLLTARRSEQLLGDMVVSHSGSNVRHILVATSNSLAAIANVVIWDADITYLSFPISAPRRMLKNGDSSFMDLINRLHRLALEQMEKDRRRSFITPLAIDELPMVFMWREAKRKAEETGELLESISYLDTRDRWSQRDLWGSEDAAILPAEGSVVNIPSEQVEMVAGIVETDVGWRDRRLVLQSQSLAICCPKDPKEDRITRGVRTELEAATAVGISSFYWQNPDWDRKNFIATQFSPAGSMGLGATEALVQHTESLDALVQAKP